MRKKDRMLYVEWDDSSSLSSAVWNKRKEATDYKVHRCRTIGFVIGEDDDTVTLAGSIDENWVSGDMKIPKSAIRKRRVLRHK